jgi:hypothetical protein
MSNRQSNLRESDWTVLVNAVTDGKCTPFIGPGLSYGHSPMGAELALRWAQEYDYPLEDAVNLPRVARFIAVRSGQHTPADLLAEQFTEVKPPNFDDRDEPYGVLADLPFSSYVTTNVDNFMMLALKARHKNPHRALCRWNRYMQEPQQSWTTSDFEPSVANPMVFHLHGAVDVPESIVITEDDYLDFLASLGRDDTAIPRVVQRACATTLLLFLGYNLDDWSFRVMYKGLSGFLERNMRRVHVAVALSTSSQESPRESVERQREYLETYFQRSDLKIYWGTVQDFTSELRRRLGGEYGA